MNTYLPIATSEDATVVATYEPEERKEKAYQSEAALEKALIEQLQRQEYEYLPIKDGFALENNLRRSLEALNEVSFSDHEWERFFKTELANPSRRIVEKTAIIQASPAALVLERDDGTQKNIHLLDKVNIHRNRLQVINQYETEGTHHNRYDVTILVNGFPLVHIELKRRGVQLREAFNQINRVFGRAMDYSSMCNCLSSRMVPTRNIMRTLPESSMLKSSPDRVSGVGRPALSSLPGGLMRVTVTLPS